MKEIPFACNMSAIEPSMRDKHIEKIKEVFQTVLEINELPDGFAFILPNESSLLIDLMTFIEKERLCCPFFKFRIEIEPEKNVSLIISGSDGIKGFIKGEFGNYTIENLSW